RPPLVNGVVSLSWTVGLRTHVETRRDGWQCQAQGPCPQQDGRRHGIGRQTPSCPVPCVSLHAMPVHVQPFLLDVSAAWCRSCGGPAIGRSRPGTKTDKRDAAWTAELLAHGLIRPRFVPPPD